MVYRTEETKAALMYLLRRGVTLIVGLCFAFLWTEYYSVLIINPFFRKGNWAVIVLYFVLYHLFTTLYGGYKIGSQRLTDIVYSNWLSLFIVNSVTYLQISLIGRKFMPFGLFVLVTFVQILLILLWANFANRIYFRLFDPKKLVFFYGKEYPANVIDKFKARPEEFSLSQIKKISSCEEAADISLSDVYGAVICDLPEERSAAILQLCLDRGIRCYVIPSLADILLRTTEIIYLFDIPLLMAKNEGLHMGQRFFKRFFDIFCSVFLIVLFLPVMLLVSFCIKLYDSGPVLYRQQRCTQHGRRFNIIKFRSMKVDAEKDGVARLAEENDPRITPVGRVIRKYRMDELPQLFNILQGDMSFVGPRPERPEMIEQYKKTLPEFDCRLSVKSGLTGYAQVIGRYNTTPEEKLKLDLIYIQSYSLLQDFKILLMTIKSVLSKESAAGIQGTADRAAMREEKDK